MTRGISWSQRPAWISTVFIALALASLVWLVFGQTLRHQFVAYDDQNYVYQNPTVTAGLTLEGVRAAFTQPQARNWHPLTTVSHMLDCELFGLDPAGHHFTNVLLHTGAVLLLFFVLRAMTDSTWRSAFVVALFAIHPLRVESVAWVAERKDVLSALFFVTTLGMYVRYVARPNATRYAGVVVAFALGLMAKPMLVTTPVVLLLLDYWPLRRSPSWKRLILEKLPLVVMSFAVALATLVAQWSTVGYGGQTPWLSRIGNGAAAYVTYAWQMFWPTKLAVFYPQPSEGIPIVTTVALVGVLAIITAVAFWQRTSRPYLIVGWLWYVIGLVPVSGLISVGLQAHADRYTYLPQIGLYLSLTWFAAELLGKTVWARPIGAIISVAVVTLLVSIARSQTQTWRNTETLWQHAADVTSNNDVAHYNLGLLAMDRSQLDQAIRHYEIALLRSGDQETPQHVSAALLHNAMGVALARQNRGEEAIAHYRKAIGLRGDYPDAHTNLADILSKSGATAEAFEHYRKVIALAPEDAEGHIRFANALRRAGQNAEALEEYRRALMLTRDPELSRKLKQAIETGQADEPSGR